MIFERFFGATSFNGFAYEDSEESENSYAYPGALRNSWVAGMSIQVDAASSISWVGHFSAGRESPNAVSLFCAHPDGSHVVVVSKGLGYVVACHQPEDWAQLPIRPIMGYCAASEQKVLVLFGYTNVLGLLSDGTMWKSRGLSWDGLRNVRVVDGNVIGEGWDAPNSKFVSFELDVLTGTGVGGSTPPKT